MMRLLSGRVCRGACLALLLSGLLVGLVGVGSALAKSPAWYLESVSEPGHFSQADNISDPDTYVITLTNRGVGLTDGSPVTITDDLPAGFTLNPIEGASGFSNDASPGSTVNCGSGLPVKCTFTGTLEPEGFIVVDVRVTVPSNGPSSAVNTVTALGGGAVSASVSNTTTVSEAPAGFGLQSFDAWVADENGLPVTQAGSHPYAASVSFNFNTVPGANAYEPSSYGWHTAGSDVRDIRVDLPPGLVGDPAAVPQCTQQQFHTHPAGFAGSLGGLTDCPNDTAVGVVSLKFGGLSGTYYPVWNVVPSPGMAAALASAWRPSRWC